jgi:hypothetical protein
MMKQESHRPMRRSGALRLAFGVTALWAAADAPAAATSITVRATDEIYAAGLKSGTTQAATLPHGLYLSSRAQCMGVQSVLGSKPCKSPLGCISLNGSMNYLNDPDGAYAQVSDSYNDGIGPISGISAPGAGYLVAVFTAQAKPSGTAPAPLTFIQSGTKFKTLTPLLNQVFFVGDGLVGDNKGGHQRFVIPAGARRVYFGISDACGFNGPPGCYYDNQGTYTVTLGVSPDVCPGAGAP